MALSSRDGNLHAVVLAACPNALHACVRTALPCMHSAQVLHSSKQLLLRFSENCKVLILMISGVYVFISS